ncbi:MAG: presenilin family intramembrane aspartyl protease [Methanomicrobiales archaeon]|nr:presenilin family intramembrane aspartyl protease [Methanomicrobiales archaeon]
MNRQSLISQMGMIGLMLLVDVIALILASPMKEAGVMVFEDPSSMANPLLFIGILLAFTLLLLILLRIGFRRLLTWIVIVSIFFTFIYTFDAILQRIAPAWSFAGAIVIGGSAVATALLFLYPEWYVIDSLGILIAAGVSAIFGISLEILPVLLLLVLLAVYDAISVYRTKHMITLATGVLEEKIPILFVIPRRKDYSFRREGIRMEGGERGAFIMGMGDLIMPSILVVSANSFGPAAGLLGISALSLGALAGSLAGLGTLFLVLHSGKPQAGLPPINGGAIAGLLIASLITGTWGWLGI